MHEGVVSNRISLFHVNIGPVLSYGKPTSKNHVGFAHYSGAIGILTEPFDLVLVDGRFRVACFLKVVRQYVTKQWKTPYILFHDYLNRIGGRYWKSHLRLQKMYNPDIVEKYAERRQNASTLVAFTIRAAHYRNPNILAELDMDISNVESNPN